MTTLLIEERFINMYDLSANPADGAIDMIKKFLEKEENLEKVDWSEGISINTNPRIIEILRLYETNIHWELLSANPAGIELLLENQNLIDWERFSFNNAPQALVLIKQNLDKINWDSLCLNTNPEAIEILKENKDKINWTYLSANPAAADYLLINLNKVNYTEIWQNSNSKIVKFLIEKHSNRIQWDYLCINSAPEAVEYINNHKWRIEWNLLAENTNPDVWKLFIANENQIRRNKGELSRNPIIFG